MSAPASTVVEGLSPRVRGSLDSNGHRKARNGSIPACAGKPRCMLLIRGSARVYPRVCGEATIVSGTGATGKGLSPRVRGSHEATDEDNEYHGSIPACAGKPLDLLVRFDNDRVYPRVCGEAKQPLQGQMILAGLSPRVRGSRESFACRPPTIGSIPACAGKPVSFPPSHDPAKVYPRVCGEASSRWRCVVESTGLSPRVRGSLRWLRGSAVDWGSIPACAGKPEARPPHSTRTRVYPRVCGEAEHGGVPDDAV